MWDRAEERRLGRVYKMKREGGGKGKKRGGEKKIECVRKKQTM